ncbi:MAG TPA: hypothetical protein VLA72_20840, partial [Anaerolineales bacterium]|nr:hypothetical protein [Anaerolineales bacterium]
MMLHPPEFLALVKDGVGRAVERVHDEIPLSADPVKDWLMSLSGTQEPADYFLHPAAFPLMLLPWLVERQLNNKVDMEFQTDLVFSNANLYYYIRLVDNVMDGHATVETKLLPSAGYFMNCFHAVYRDYFEFGHAFWDFFRVTWEDFCDVTMADGLQTDMDEKTF